MMPRHHVVFGLASLALAGCASQPRDEPPAPAAASAASNTASSSPLRRWTGNLTPTNQRTGAVTGGGAGQARAFGTVLLTVAESSPQRTRARITLTSPVNSVQLRWALLPGRCGSGAMPVMAVELFPLLDIGTNGRGQLDAEVPLTLPESGSYHVNVYWAGQQLSDVMTCTNLRYEA
jgi:hypothetical protein